MGGRFSQWANGKLVHDNIKVSSKWMVSTGTFGLGSHRSPQRCKTLYDNIKVTFVVSSPPKVNLGSFQSFVPEISALLGEKKVPVDSCK